MKPFERLADAAKVVREVRDSERDRNAKRLLRHAADHIDDAIRIQREREHRLMQEAFSKETT